MAKGYEVTVAGEYIARSGVMDRERINKEYRIKCVIPQMNKALSTIKNKLLGPLLKKNYPDYVAFRTYHILKIEPLGKAEKVAMDSSDIRYMDRDTLLDLIKGKGLPVPANLYPNLFKLREAVKHALEDRDGYEAFLAKHREDLELDVQVAALNPEIQNEESEVDAPIASGSVGVDTAPAKPKAISDEKARAKNTEDRMSGLEAEMKRDGELADLDTQEDAASDLSDL